MLFAHVAIKCLLCLKHIRTIEKADVCGVSIINVVFFCILNKNYCINATTREIFLYMTTFGRSSSLCLMQFFTNWDTYSNNCIFHVNTWVHCKIQTIPFRRIISINIFPNPISCSIVDPIHSLCSCPPFCPGRKH